MKRKILLLPLIAITNFGCVPLSACHKPQDHRTIYDVMKDDYKNMLINCVDTSDYDHLTVEEIMAQLTLESVTIDSKTVESFKFIDLDYDSKDPAWWPPHQHLRRTTTLCVLGAKKHNTSITKIALKLLYFWLGNNFTNTNWWFGMIGVPQELTNIGLFLEDLLECGKTTWEQDYQYGTFKYNPEETKKQTGTNLFWCADISLKSGLFDEDDQQIKEVQDLVKSEIQIHDGDGEGFQDDGSYFQHGNQLYNGGYGRQGVLVICRMLSAFVHQNMFLTDQQVDIVDTFPLDGMKYFTHKGYVNYQTMGRTYTRKDSILLTAGVTDLGNITEFKTLATLKHCPRKTELSTLINNWQNKKSTFNGIKYFPRSCMLTMNIDGVYMSFKGTNSNLINAEAGNGENLLGYNLSYGTTTCVMSTGKEYFDIPPVWYYDSLPGTTSLTETDEELKTHTPLSAPSCRELLMVDMTKMNI